MARDYLQILKQLDKERNGKLKKIIFGDDDLLRLKQSSESQIKLEGLSDYYRMRRSWGTFLAVCLGIILAFNISLVIFTGLGFLKYQDNWFLRIVLTTNLADIIGLVYLVVNFLFSNNLDKADTKIKQ